MTYHDSYGKALRRPMVGVSGSAYSNKHEWNSACVALGCRDVYSMGVTPPVQKAVGAPEFTITIDYRGENGSATRRPGFHYAIQWKNEEGNDRYSHGWGHETAALAEQAAKTQADQIARTFYPRKTFKYTPDV